MRRLLVTLLIALSISGCASQTPSSAKPAPAVPFSAPATIVPPTPTVAKPTATARPAATSRATAPPSPTAAPVKPTATDPVATAVPVAPIAPPAIAATIAVPAVLPTKPAPSATRAPIPTAQDVGAYPCQPGQIKGNRNSMIFHAPGQRDYEKTQANVQCFDTAAQAEAAGYRQALR